MACKRLEDAIFIWPAIKDAMTGLIRARFEALSAGLDWRHVKALETRPPAAVK
jgi:transposase